MSGPDRSCVIDLHDAVVHPGGPRTPAVLQGCSLTIAPGESAAVVGESGAGKTTLLRALAGLIPLSEGTLHRPAPPGWLPQHPGRGFDPRWPIIRAVAEPLRLAGARQGAEKSAAGARAAEALFSCGLEPALARRRPHELSGGQLRRAALARALVADPPVVLADEPTAGLDPPASLALIDLVREAVTARDTALVWVTHDLGVAAAVADRLLVLADGRIVEEGPAQQVLARPQSPTARALTRAWLPLEPRLARERFQAGVNPG